MQSILIVEEDPRVCDALSRELGHRFAIEMAETSQQALEVMERLPMDVILVDVGLAQPDGLCLLSQVRRRWPRTYRVLMSDSAGVYARLMLASDLAQDFLTKPMVADELIDCIGRAA